MATASFNPSALAVRTILPALPFGLTITRHFPCQVSLRGCWKLDISVGLPLPTPAISLLPLISKLTRISSAYGNTLPSESTISTITYDRSFRSALICHRSGDNLIPKGFPSVLIVSDEVSVPLSKQRAVKVPGS